MVYVLQMGDTSYVKIGFTSRDDVAARLAELQTACPLRLRVVATFEGDEVTEAELHRRFYHCRTNGGDEWFDIPDIARELEHYGKQQSGYQRAVGGDSPFDFRPVRGGQQHAVAQRREDVSIAGYGSHDARPQYPQFTRSGKHKIGLSSVLWEGREDDSIGDQQLHNDLTVRDSDPG